MTETFLELRKTGVKKKFIWLVVKPGIFVVQNITDKYQTIFR